MFFPKCLWIICCFYIITSYAELHLKFTNLECHTNPKYFHNHSCRLKAVNRYKTVGSMKTFIKDTLRNVSINIAMYKRNDYNAYKPFLVNTTQNLCKFLDKRSSGFYMNMVVNLLNRYSNVNHSCPYSGVVFMENVYMDENYGSFVKILSQWFHQSYKFMITFYESYPLEHIGYASFYMEVVENRKSRKQQIELPPADDL